jgi:hypothetical protein
VLALPDILTGQVGQLWAKRNKMKNTKVGYLIRNLAFQDFY